MEGGGLVSGRDVLGKDNCISGGIEIRDLLFTITAAAMLCALKICSKLSLDGYRTSGRTNWPVILVYDGGIYQTGPSYPEADRLFLTLTKPSPLTDELSSKVIFLTCRTRTLTWIGSPSPDLSSPIFH